MTDGPIMDAFKWDPGDDLELVLDQCPLGREVEWTCSARLDDRGRFVECSMAGMSGLCLIGQDKR